MASADVPDGTADVAVVIGTRPEIVKLAGVIRLLGDRAWTVHTGQHWDDRLSGSFLRDLGVGEPSTVLGIGGLARGVALGQMTAALAGLWGERRPEVVVVQGDTTSALAGALAANACDLPLVHVEAGLRSHDRAMPEEHNRVVVDHLADRCAAPTETCRANLAAEGIAGERVVLTGNTVVDAVKRLCPPPGEVAAILATYGVKSDRFVLSTFHRPENVDDPIRLEEVLCALGTLTADGWRVVLPLHPRTAATAERTGLSSLLIPLEVVAPLDYRAFLGLASGAALVVSDSGGVQEEVSVIKRPVLVVRRSTERPEVLGTFAELISPAEIVARSGPWLQDPAAVRARLRDLPSPYGDGRASDRCVAIVEQLSPRA